MSYKHDIAVSPGVVTGISCISRLSAAYVVYELDVTAINDSTGKYHNYIIQPGKVLTGLDVS